MTDPFWIKSLLGVHIAAGFTAFLMAPIALATAKGGKAHRFWGKIYFWAMAVVASSAIALSVYRPILFLALVAVFSFYAAFSAYRVLYYKNLPRGQKVHLLDWVAALFTFVSSLTMAFLGVARPVLVQHMTIPSLVFGAIGMFLSGKAMWKFTHPPAEKMFWWYAHLGNMLASYIAAWTAFSVVTLGRFFRGDWDWVIWVLPTAIGAPAIFLTTAYYKRKFTPRERTTLAPTH